MKKLNKLCNGFFNGLDLSDIVGADAAKEDNKLFNKVLDRFLEKGNKEDAFEVYYCFSEIFRLFGKGYDNTQKLLELLSDHEYHSGELLSKHRDHYSHSVYVFALGLAVYAHDKTFRNNFLGFYDLPDNAVSASTYLYLWGMTSLFHDIGYPFQLAHEQIKIYTSELWGEKAGFRPYVSFGNLDKFIAIDENVSDKLSDTLCIDRKFTTLDELLAYGLNKRLGFDENFIVSLLRERIINQPKFVDHGYFGAVTLAKQLLDMPEFKMTEQRLDVITAILLHNSLSKFDLKNSHPISAEEHPLAYMLMLCDELQNWDRLAYGKVSKRDPIAWDIKIDISDNKIQIDYLFDSRYVKDSDNNKRECKSFAEISSGDYAAAITGNGNKKGFLSTSLVLNLNAGECRKKKKSTLYASDNSFINLCDFAKAIHASYLEECRNMQAEYINETFDKLPLEFKISNIEQAKSYAEKLELISCFYSNKDLDYPVVEDFKKSVYGNKNADNLGFLCREEHVRWVKEKLSMGWKYGTDYSSSQERNKKKIHRDIIPYEELDEKERKKDEVMINNIIPLLKKFGSNIRIYSYRTGRKPDLEIAGTGHRFFKGDREKIKKEIKKIIEKYSENNRVIVRTCFAYGADQLISECALEAGVTVKAVIPTDYENYIKVVRKDCIDNGIPFTEEDELRMRHLIAQTAVCKTVKDENYFYTAASKYIVDKCDKLIALWDGKELPLEENGKPVNMGGTYYCINEARKRGLKDGEDIYIIPCER